MKTDTQKSTNENLAQLILGMEARMLEKLEETTRKVVDERLARGTPAPSKRERERETRRVETPVQVSPPASLEDRVRHALTGTPVDITQLAKDVHESKSALEALLVRLEAEGRATKLDRGGGLHLWVWRPGPNATSVELKAVIIGLLMTEPMRNSDLIRITQANAKQVENAMVDLRRKEPIWWMNKGVGGHGAIYWMSADRRDPPPELDGRLDNTNRNRRRNQAR